jgi:dynein heavy chain
MEQSKPKDIPGILPEVLNSVRIIWELSEHYNTSERMKGLLTKISNQIIKRCRARINKNDMLEGDVEKCMQDLEESITCCREWKSICLRQQELIKKYSSRKGWELDTDETIFAENEAFIQRCKDLLEICEGQLQFARKGAKQVMPVFGGTKGPEYTESLKELERTFAKHLQNIKDLDYDILDVKQTRWHDDYGQYFKEQCKSLEILYQNIIVLAFKNVSTVGDAVEMLENFDSLAKRPLVRDYVHKRAAEMVYKLFKDEIKEVEETFDGHDKAGKGPPPMPFSHPQYGGLAIWARALIVRIDRAKTAIEGLYFIPEHPHAKDAIDAYTKLRTALDNFIANTCFTNWKEEIRSFETEGTSIDSKLEVPVLIRAEQNTRELPSSLSGNALFARDKKNGLLESNFDSDLHKVMVEVAYWTKIQTLGFVTIPHTVARLLQRKEQLRILRENVMLIVRDYNTIIHTVSDEEKSLFKEHLDILDRTIDPGIRRHNWGSQADNFVYACRKECQDVFLNVKKFQSNVAKVQSEFERIGTTTLTNVQKKLYLLSEFTRGQEETLQGREREFTEAFEKIARKVLKTYELFIHRGPKVQSEWLRFVRRLDESLERSLKQCVKNTLLDLGKHILGDKQRAELVPIFRVYTILDPAPHQASWKIIHDPTHDQLRSSIQHFMKQIIHVTRVVPRIEKVFRERRGEKIAALKAELDEAEKGGGNPAAALAKAGMRQDGNYQNLSPEEKEIKWREKWDLPRADEKLEYEERIAKNKKIQHKTAEILTGIEKIQANMEEDRKHWQASEEVRQLQNIRTAKGR